MLPKPIWCFFSFAFVQPRQDAKMEAKYLDDLRSTNVIGYQAVAQPKMRQVDIFMEYANNGDLAQEIEQRARAQ
jgi:hypothetical protein